MAIYYITTTVTVLLGCFLQVFAVADRDIANQRPHQVRAEVINSTSIRIKWRQPKAEIVCPTKRYMIRLKEINGLKERSKARTWKFNSSHTSAIVHELRPNSDYMVRVVAENCDSRWKSSKWIKARTSTDGNTLDRTAKDIGDNSDGEELYQTRDGRPPGQPTHVRSQAYENSVFVSWQAPPSDAGTFVRGYKIGYGEGIPDVNWQYLEGRQRNVTIRNLKRATQYVVTVAAYNDFGTSTPIYDLVYTTGSTGTVQRNSSVLPAPTDLRVKLLNPTSVRLKWFDLSLGVGQEIKDGRYYNVRYRTTTAEGKAMSILVKDLHVQLKDLLPSMRYEFRIRTVRDGQMSDFSDTVYARTTDDEEEEEEEEKEEEEESREKKTGEEQEGKRGPSGSQKPEADKVSKEHAGDRRQNDLTDEYDDFEGDSENATDPAEDYLEAETTATEDARQLQHQTKVPPSIERKRRIQPRRDSLYTVSFRSVVYHRISAFVTWPQHPQQTCISSSSSSSNSYNNQEHVQPDVIGYRLRYQQLPLVAGESDPEVYTTQELGDNFLLLENLQPESKYRYQIQYLFSGNASISSAWSGEGVIDTQQPKSTASTRNAAGDLN